MRIIVISLLFVGILNTALTDNNCPMYFSPNTANSTSGAELDTFINTLYPSLFK